jgi:hypothetical protein
VEKEKKMRKRFVIRTPEIPVKNELLAKIPGNRHTRFRRPSGALAYMDGKSGTLPHPYFAYNMIVFNVLQAWMRCKILQDKELRDVSATARGILADRRGWDDCRKSS